MTRSKLHKTLGQVVAGLILGAILSLIIIQFKPKSESELMLAEAYASFKEFKDDPYYMDAAISNAIFIHKIDSTSKAAKECSEWAIQNGTTIQNLVMEESIKMANQPKYSIQQIDSIGKATNDYLLYKGMPGNADDAFEKVHIAFEGMPATEKVKGLMESVMSKYNIVINSDNVLKVANVLVVLKEESKVGVTEMDILKHIYQHGSADVDYPTQAAISASMLELYK